MTLLLAALGCMAVGLLIGWCGVAGFLLPILFVNLCGLTVTESLFVSFSCFALSGIIGSVNYRRRGELPLKPALMLAAGSLAGSLLGAALGNTIPPETIKTVLYLVVLLSGLSIGIKELRPASKGGGTAPFPKPALLLLLGLTTAMICSLSGAGGPVLVMPLLVALGIPAKAAVGIALLDSVFIALPALCVYGSNCSPLQILPLFLAAFFSHGLGICIGSVTADRIPAGLLKRGVALFSICFAIFMLIKQGGLIAT